MNSERDNFYDWSKEKTDTSFSDFHRSGFSPIQRRRPSPWPRIALFALLVIALAVTLKLLLAH